MRNYIVWARRSKSHAGGGGYSLINQGKYLIQEVTADSFLYGDEWEFDEQKIEIAKHYFTWLSS